MAGAGAGAGAEIIDKGGAMAEIGAENKEFRLRNTAFYYTCGSYRFHLFPPKRGCFQFCFGF